VSFLIWAGNMVWAIARGPQAEADPWGARTLEWQTSSPPPLENFPAPPIVTGHPYDYGIPDAPQHGVLTPAGASGEGSP
jgi:cytochrome c oxidase subunit 1